MFESVFSVWTAAQTWRGNILEEQLKSISHCSTITIKYENHLFIKVLILSEYAFSVHCPGPGPGPEWGLLASVWWGKYFEPQLSNNTTGAQNS